MRPKERIKQANKIKKTKTIKTKKFALCGKLSFHS